MRPRRLPIQSCQYILTPGARLCGNQSVAVFRWADGREQFTCPIHDRLMTGGLDAAEYEAAGEALRGTDQKLPSPAVWKTTTRRPSSV